MGPRFLARLRAKESVAAAGLPGFTRKPEYIPNQPRKENLISISFTQVYISDVTSPKARKDQLLAVSNPQLPASVKSQLYP